MFGRYSERAQRAIIHAQDEARRLDYNYAGTEHLLLGIIDEDKGIAAVALRRLGVELEQARAEVERTLGKGSAPASGQVQFTPRGKRVIMELALDQARSMGHNYVGTEHLLLGLLAEGECFAARLLTTKGATPERVRAKVLELLGGGASSLGPAAPPPPEPPPG